MDTSDYPKSHPLYSPINAKVLGKFKDETASISPLQFVGLRSKMYSLLLPDDKVKLTAKGIKKQYVKKYITHSQYLNCLVECKQTNAKFCNIRSRNHILKTESVSKIALSPFDDKRYILKDSTDTLAYGHFRTKNM